MSERAEHREGFPRVTICDPFGTPHRSGSLVGERHTPATKVALRDDNGLDHTRCMKGRYYRDKRALPPAAAGHEAGGWEPVAKTTAAQECFGKSGITGMPGSTNPHWDFVPY
jgi:hypothetical protein